MMRKKKSENILDWCNKRQFTSQIHTEFERCFQINLPLAKRLGLEQELEGHTGCVNCLDWNESGELLGSGSDDFNVILWDINRRRPQTVLKTGHEGNIFSVKFLPCTDSNLVASAAADATVRVHCVSTLECRHTFTCHTRRVKRLSVTKQSPYLMWSGSEDGTVREFDLRQKHYCSSVTPCGNTIINHTEHINPTSEVKCIEVHPLYPELIAVGGSDPFVRLYDRRMISSSADKRNGKNDSDQATGCIGYYAPGHLPMRPGRGKPAKHRNYVTTHLSFSPDGQELLQNLGGEHIYLYSLKQHRKPLIFSVNDKKHDCSINPIKRTNGLNNGFMKNGLSNGVNSTSTQNNDRNSGVPDTVSAVPLEQHEPNNELPENALYLKQKGNDAFAQHNYFQAVVCYSDALKLVPDSSVLYANRAAALLKRCWDGDLYAALRDCQIAVELDITHSKAFYRQARCLFELKWYNEAYICLQLFKERFPDQADGYSINKLENDVTEQVKLKERDPLTENGEHRRRAPQSTSNDEERARRENAFDFEKRFVGACNTTTDIKEANYFGNDGKFVIAGSDCGCMLLWDKATTNLIEAWQGDESIVNCLQPHPSSCLVATSGIDPVVRLWTPRTTESSADGRTKEVEGLVRANQKRMNTDPLEEMLRTMGYRTSLGDLASDDDDDDPTAMQCRTT